MNIFEEIRNLNWPIGSYVVVGGGVLVALELIEWDDDIDIAVKSEIFDKLKVSGWRQEQWQDKIVLKNGIYDVGMGFGDWTLEQLFEDALWIDNIPFISLLKLKTWKTEMGRPKDLESVIKIDDYLIKSEA